MEHLIDGSAFLIFGKVSGAVVVTDLSKQCQRRSGNWPICI